MNTRDVEVGLILDEEDACRKAEIFIHSRPGLKWNGRWTTTQVGKMSVIGVTAGDKCEVPVGTFWSQSHAEETTQKFIQRNPHLKWNGQWKTTEPNGITVIEVEPLPNLMGERNQDISINLNNSLNEKISNIDVSELVSDEWDQKNRPDKKFQGKSIGKMSILSDWVGVNYWANSAPFKMKFSLEKGGAIAFHVDARVTIDSTKEAYDEAQWSVQVDGMREDVSIYYTTTPDERSDGALNVFVCDTKVLEEGLLDEKPLSQTYYEYVQMSRDSPEVEFWRTLIKLLQAAKPQLVKPNGLQIFENMISRHKVDWNLIFNFTTPQKGFAKMMQDSIHELLNQVNMSNYPSYLAQLLYYAQATVKYRLDHLKGGSERAGHLHAARLWRQCLLALSNRYMSRCPPETEVTVIIVNNGQVVYLKLKFREIKQYISDALKLKVPEK